MGASLFGLAVLHPFKDANEFGPTPLILLGAGVKKDYSHQINYSQGSVLRTLQEIFGVSPFLGSADQYSTAAFGAQTVRHDKGG